jgi:CubicO group peptidase (beta-lactamase class C family)
MPRGLLTLICVVLLGASATCTAASSLPSVTNPSVQAAIVAAVQKDRQLYGGRTPVPGVLIGVWDGRGGSFVRTFGYANVQKRVPLTPADHFRIGSNTKTFVVSVILQLVDERRLKLDDPISSFDLGVKIPNAKNITVRELCNMRSGLFEAYDTPQFDRLADISKMTFDPRTLIKWAVQQKPYFPPGSGYRYSNTNYLLLGLIIEKLTHDTVGDQIDKRLLVPFGLTQTSYPYTMAMPTPWAHGYGLDANRNWEDVSGTIPVSLMGAAGAMISDMNDQAVRDRQNKFGRNVPRFDGMRFHRRTGAGLRFGARLQQRMVWLYGRASRIQHREFLLSRNRCHDRRLGGRAKRQAAARGCKRNVSRYRARPDAQQRSLPGRSEGPLADRLRVRRVFR